MGATTRGLPYPEAMNTPTLHLDLRALAEAADTGDTALQALIDALGLFGTWTPSGANWSGTASGRYTVIGKLVFFSAEIVLSGPLTGSFGFSLPAPIRSEVNMPIGRAFLNDASVSGAAGVELYDIRRTSSSSGIILAPDGTTTGPSVPWTWAAGDAAYLSGWYERT